MAAHISHPLFVAGSLTLTLAMLACGISFFGPYWLMNVTSPGQGREGVESSLKYINRVSPEMFSYRGLWAQCSDVCQWFWESNYSLQTNKFSILCKQLLYYLYFYKFIFYILYIFQFVSIFLMLYFLFYICLFYIFIYIILYIYILLIYIFYSFIFIQSFIRPKPNSPRSWVVFAPHCIPKLKVFT